jgi:tripartite-type tricarboxylate transporter receptor subunit TctC
MLLGRSAPAPGLPRRLALRGPRRRALAWAVLALIPWAALAYPDKPITLVVPYPPGGATDTIGRLVAKGLSEQLGQVVRVDNRPGAGTTLGATFVAQAVPDGHTLLISSNTTFTINPSLKSRLPYDPLKSFEAVGLLGSGPLVLLAHPSLPALDVSELIRLAKARPGELSLASFGRGTSSDLAGALFQHLTDTRFIAVPYQGSAPAMQDLIGGQVQLSFDTLVAALPQIQAGRIRALAVTSLQPSPRLPTLPSLALAGVPGFDLVPWLAVVAPRGLPAAVARQLAQALAVSLAKPGLRAELTQAGLDVASEPPAAYEARINAELPRLRATVHQAGLVAD